VDRGVFQSLSEDTKTRSLFIFVYLTTLSLAAAGLESDDGVINE
jgi:hypothetical protein